MASLGLTVKVSIHCADHGCSASDYGATQCCNQIGQVEVQYSKLLRLPLVPLIPPFSITQRDKATLDDVAWSEVSLQLVTCLCCLYYSAVTSLHLVEQSIRVRLFTPLGKISIEITW